MKLRLSDSHRGQGVFAVSCIVENEALLEFRGPRIAAEDMPQPYDAVTDHCLQIGPRLYLGPSGELDDFVNHSCDPNSGLRFEAEAVTLVSIRTIEPGEEITFDYSTTMDEDDWELECACGASCCRGRIRDFRKLPREVKARYIRLGIVPEFLRSI